MGRIRKRVIGLIMTFVFIIINLPEIVWGSHKDEMINFKKITSSDGLSQTSAQYIHQDRDGYIWIGTSDGLNKYNGINFEVYRYREDMQNSISSNYIAAINEDSKGNLWVGTSVGLNKINLDTNKITVYDVGNEEGMLGNGNITEIYINKEDQVYIATIEGLYLYNEKKDDFTRLYNSENETESLSDQFIYSVTEDSNGHLWVGTDNGLNRIDKDTKKITKFYPQENKNSLQDKLIYKINSQDEGYLWIGTYSGGLTKLDINTYKMITYRANPKDENSLQSDFIRYILRDSVGVLWIATEEGLSKMNEKTEQFITYKSKIYDEKSLVSNNVFSLMEDSAGTIWVGTYSGISMFSSNNSFKLQKNDPFDENSLSESMMAGIYEDDEEVLWIGTVHSGVDILNRKTGEIKKLKANLEDKENYIINDQIRDIVGYKNKIWIATAEGLSMYDKSTNKITNYIYEEGNKNSLSHNDVRTLYIDDEEVLWIGTAYSLSTFDIKTEKFTTMEEICSTKDKVPYMITDIIEDNNKNIWIAAGLNNGLLRYNKETKEVTKYKKNKYDINSLSFDSTRALAVDKNGDIWVGTQYGLNRFNKDDETFTRYTEEDGLSNNFVYGILVDDENNLWMSTNNGISKFIIKEERFIKFNVNDGLQDNEFNGYSYYKSAYGEMFFGGIKGLTSFYPKDVKVESFDFPVIIEKVINGEKLLEKYDNIFLKYGENNIQFDFFLPYYINRTGVEYSYMLEGLDSEWSYSNNRHYANYTNLAAGKYTFKVRAKTANGDWTEPTLIKFEVQIKPWESPLAYFIYSIFIVTIILLIWNRVKLLNIIVEQKTEENRKLDQKLIENMKYKNNYFLNLSHELRTPLNVILSSYQLISKLNEDEKEIPKEKMKSYMESIKKNADRLLNLISNIIDTSKVESGNYKLNIKKVNIIYEIEEIALSMKDLVEERNIELIIDPEVEEKVIECDIVEIEKCIINLIGNAIKFTSPGGMIKLSMFDLDNKVKISIKDNGVGISKEYHKTIFNRFGQAYNSITEEHGGSGLGLTLTKQLIEIHGGEIIVKSEVGLGSEFIIILPVKHKYK